MSSKIRKLNIEAGFPSPADDYLEEPLDLNDLITHPEATFFTRMESNALHGDGIYEGDLLVVNRALKPRPGDMVIAIVEDTFLARKLVSKDGSLVLEQDPESFLPLKDLEIWGVISNVIRRLR